MDPLLILNLLLATGLVGSWVSHWLEQQQKKTELKAKRRVLFHQLQLEIGCWLRDRESGSCITRINISSVRRVLDADVLDYASERPLIEALIQLQNSLCLHTEIVQMYDLQAIHLPHVDRAQGIEKIADRSAAATTQMCRKVLNFLPIDPSQVEAGTGMQIQDPTQRQIEQSAP